MTSFKNKVHRKYSDIEPLFGKLKKEKKLSWGRLLVFLDWHFLGVYESIEDYSKSHWSIKNRLTEKQQQYFNYSQYAQDVLMNKKTLIKLPSNKCAIFNDPETFLCYYAPDLE